MKALQQPAYVLHSRPYRDTSLLLELLTPEYGRLGLVARGARRKTRGGSNGALLQPFKPLLVSFAGRGELKTLTAVEVAGGEHRLLGQRLYSGLYMNELLVRVLHRHDPHPTLFAAYGDALEKLATAAGLEEGLRRFELILLDELGYSFDLSVEGDTGEAVIGEGWYQFRPGCGLVARRDLAEPGAPAYAGSDLLAMAAGNLGGELAATAKRLLREALVEHLGGQPLKSRDLFHAQAPIKRQVTNTGDRPVKLDR